MLNLIHSKEDDRLRQERLARNRLDARRSRLRNKPDLVSLPSSDESRGVLCDALLKQAELRHQHERDYFVEVDILTPYYFF